MVIEISVAIIALAFVALVFYVIVMTKALRQTLIQVNQTLIEVRKQLGEVGGQAVKAVEHTNQISFDLKRKMESLDPIFYAFSNIGDFLEYKTLSLKREALKATHHEKKLSNDELSAAEEGLGLSEPVRTADFIEIVAIAFRLWQKIKKRRRK